MASNQSHKRKASTDAACDVVQVDTKRIKAPPERVDWNVGNYAAPLRAVDFAEASIISPQATLVSDVHQDYKLSALFTPRNHYEYRPIRTDETRLLQLLPSIATTDAVRVSLRPFRYESMPEYEALSYVWGEQVSPLPIWIDGSLSYVGPNLHMALLRLRRRDRPILLWIDAICINQVDLQERGEQVSKMATIYQNARRTVVWLDAPPSQCDIVLGLINAAVSTDNRELSHILARCPAAAGVFSQFLHNDWFKRLWIIQEVLLARESIFVLGENQEMSWQNLASTAKLLHNSLGNAFPGGGQHAVDQLIDIGETTLIRSANSGDILGRRNNLEYLVTELCDFNATDPRDAVYSMLSLARGQTIVPDYRNTTLDVFSQFTAQCVDISGSLDILLRPWAPLEETGFQGGLVDPDLRFAVPSWMCIRSKRPFADFSTTRKHGDSLVGSAEKAIYDTSSGRRADVRFGMDARTGSFDGRVHAKGLILGNVLTLSTRMADGIVHKDALEVFRMDPDGITTSARLSSDNLWRTLVADRDSRQSSTPSLYRLAMAQIFRQFPNGSSIDTSELLDTTECHQEPYVEEFLRRVQAVTFNRKAFRVKWNGSESAGIGPHRMKVGDCICILFGCSVPVVLRQHRTEAGSFWQLIGECYLHGVMEGEAMYSLTEQEISRMTEEFEIR